MPKVAVTFACGLYDRMSALYTGEVKPEGIDLNFLAIDAAADFRPHGEKSRVRRLRNVELRGLQPARRRPQRDGCTAGISFPRLPPRFHHRQPQSSADAEEPRG